MLEYFDHPNIVKYIESFRLKTKSLSIVMEYVENGDLENFLHNHIKAGTELSEDQILDCFTQICLAIKHVHDRNCIHRDIKPSNIFITLNGTYKLGDFGVSKIFNECSKTVPSVGTPQYWSPELI